MKKEKLFVVERHHQVVNPCSYCVPLGEVNLGCWFAPSLVEVEACGLLPLVRGGVWFVSLFGRGVGCCIGYGPTPLV